MERPNTGLKQSLPELDPKNSSLHFLLGQAAYRHLGKSSPEAKAEFTYFGTARESLHPLTEFDFINR